MGFLDKQSQIVDVVLTEHGRRLYASGKLDLVYFAVLDDGVDYDPYPATLSDTDRETMIEHASSFEAPIVMRRNDPIGTLEPVNHVFTAADGFETIPQISSPMTSSFDVSCAQYVAIDSKYARKATSRANILMALDGEAEAGAHGFTVRVFSSGSSPRLPSRLLRQWRRDSDLRRAFDPFIACTIDDEPTVDAPVHTDPRSIRR